jgi:hypothetical protein
LFAKIAEVTQIIANKGKLRLVWIDLLDVTNSLNCSVLKNVATKTVNGVGRINDYSPSVKTFNHRFDNAWLGIFRMDL